jgi:tripartite-type tricarboxylate transporter receptor subunit TctC
MLAGVALLMATTSVAVAQGYPAKPIRFVVPHTVAGSPDILARFLGTRLGDTLGQQVVVDNLAGAAGIVGAERVARAAPDGYTLFVGSSAVVINPNLYKKVSYDVVRDFQPITALALAPLVLVVHPSLPARSVREFIALVKSKPGAINYASGGSGSAAHMAAELFKSMAGVDMVHVPYKGTAPALIDLAGGHVSVGFYTVSATSGHVKTGRLRALGLTALKRSPAVPGLPTVAEAGLPGYEASTWIGVLAPAGTPRELVERLHGEITKILALPDVQQAFAVQGFDMIANTPAEFAAQIKSDLAKWARVIKVAKLTVD